MLQLDTGPSKWRLQLFAIFLFLLTGALWPSAARAVSANTSTSVTISASASGYYSSWPTVTLTVTDSTDPTFAQGTEKLHYYVSLQSLSLSTVKTKYASSFTAVTPLVAGNIVPDPGNLAGNTETLYVYYYSTDEQPVDEAVHRAVIYYDNIAPSVMAQINNGSTFYPNGQYPAYTGYTYINSAPSTLQLDAIDYSQFLRSNPLSYVGEGSGVYDIYYNLPSGPGTLPDGTTWYLYDVTSSGVDISSWSNPGLYTFYVAATDYAGNNAATPDNLDNGLSISPTYGTFKVIYDQTAPITWLGYSGTLSGVSASNTQTGAASVISDNPIYLGPTDTVTINAYDFPVGTETVSGVSYIDYSGSGPSGNFGTNPYSSSYAIGPASGSTNIFGSTGSYTLHFGATDWATNFSGNTTQSFTYIKETPVLSVKYWQADGVTAIPPTSGSTYLLGANDKVELIYGDSTTSSNTTYWWQTYDEIAASSFVDTLFTSADSTKTAPSVFLIDGSSYPFEAYTKNLARTVSSTYTATVNYDGTAPDTSLSTPISGTYTSTNSSAIYASSAQPVTLTVDDPVENSYHSGVANTFYEVKSAAGPDAETLIGTNYSTLLPSDIIPLTAFSSGDNYLYFYSVDNARNIQAIQSPNDIIVYNTTPTDTLSLLDASSVAVGLTGSYYFVNSSAQIENNITNEAYGFQSFADTVSVPSIPNTHATTVNDVTIAAFNSAYKFTTISSLTGVGANDISEGVPFTYSATGVNYAGNSFNSTPATLSNVVLDTKAPATTIEVDKNGTSQGSSPYNINIATSDTVSVKLTATDDTSLTTRVSGAKAIYWVLTDNNNGNAVLAGNITTPVTVSDGTPITLTAATTYLSQTGSYTLSYYSIDNAENAENGGTPISVTITVSGTPTTTFTIKDSGGPVNVTDTASASQTAYYVGPNLGDFSLSVASGYTTGVVTLANKYNVIEASTGLTTPSTSGDYTITGDSPVTLANVGITTEGGYTVQAWSYHGTNVEAAPEHVVYVVNDTHAPTIDSIKLGSGAITPGSTHYVTSAPTLTVTASDPNITNVSPTQTPTVSGSGLYQIYYYVTTDASKTPTLSDTWTSGGQVSGSITIPTNANATNYVWVYATDKVNNASTPILAATIIYDNVPPTASLYINSSATAVPDGSTQYVQSLTEAHLAATAGASDVASITYSVNGNTYIYTNPTPSSTTATTDGSTAVPAATLLSLLSSGGTVYYWSTNGAGASTAHQSATIVVAGLTTPTLSLLVNGAAVPASPNNWYDAVTGVSLNATSGTASPIATISYSIIRPGSLSTLTDTVTISPQTSPASVSLPASDFTATGSYSVSFSATDSAGNTASSGPTSFTVVTSDAPTTTLAFNAYLGANGYQYFSSSFGTVDTSTIDSAGFAVNLNSDETLTNVSSPYTVTANSIKSNKTGLTATDLKLTTVGEGGYTLNVKGSNAYHQESPGASALVAYDTTAPSTTITPVSPTATVSGVSYFTGLPSVTISATDPVLGSTSVVGSGVAKIYYEITNSANSFTTASQLIQDTNNTVTTSSSVTLSPSSLPAVGAYYVYAVAVDNVGNVGSVVSTEIYYDNTTPVTGLFLGTSGTPATYGATIYTNSLSDAKLVVTTVPASGIAAINYTINEVPRSTGATSVDIYSDSAFKTTGTNNITYYSTSVAGKVEGVHGNTLIITSAPPSSTLTINSDDLINGGQVAERSVNSASLVATGQVAPIASVNVTISDGTLTSPMVLSYTLPSYQHSYTYDVHAAVQTYLTNNPSVTLSDGVYSVSFGCTDAAGNTNSNTGTLIIYGSDAPVTTIHTQNGYSANGYWYASASNGTVYFTETDITGLGTATGHAQATSITTPSTVVGPTVIAFGSPTANTYTLGGLGITTQDGYNLNSYASNAYNSDSANSQTSATQKVAYDTTGPNAPTFAATNANTSTSTSSVAYFSALPTVTISATDPALTASVLGSGVKSIYYQLSTSSTAPSTALPGSWTLGSTFNPSSLSAGTYYLYAVAVDNVGNIGAIGTLEVVYDPATPTTSLYVNGSLMSTTVINYVSAVQSATLSTTDTDVSSLSFKVDNGSKTTYSALDTTLKDELSPAGSHTVKYGATSNAGLTDEWNTATVVVSTTAPTTSLTVSGSVYNNGIYWVKSTPTVTITGVDTSGAPVTIHYTVDGIISGSLASPANINSVTSINALLSTVGTHTVSFYGTSAGGTETPVHTATITYDVTAPTASVSALTINGSSAINVTLADAGSGINVAASYYTIDGGAQQSFTSTSPKSGARPSLQYYPSSVTATSSTSKAAHTVTVYAVDALGNSNTTTTSLSASIWSTPILTSLSPNSANHGSAATKITAYGYNFIKGAVIYWGNSSLTTTFVDSGTLTATLSKTQLQKAGSVSVTVKSSGFLSNALPFTLN